MVRKLLNRFTIIVFSLILFAGMSYLTSQNVSATTSSNSIMKKVVNSNKNLENRNRDDNAAARDNLNVNYNSTLPTSNITQSNIKKILFKTITFPQTFIKFATKLPQTGLQKSEVSLLGIIVLIFTSIVGYHGFFKKNDKE